MCSQITCNQPKECLDVVIEVPDLKRAFAQDKREAKNIHSRIAYQVQRSRMTKNQVFQGKRLWRKLFKPAAVAKSSDLIESSMGELNYQTTDEATDDELQENMPSFKYSNADYQRVHFDISEARSNYNLSSLEIKEIIRRNFQNASKNKSIDLDLTKQVEEFLHWISLTGISTPIFDLHPEKVKKKSKMWKHLA